MEQAQVMESWKNKMIKIYEEEFNVFLLHMEKEIKENDEWNEKQGYEKNAEVTEQTLALQYEKWMDETNMDDRIYRKIMGY